MIWVWLIRSSDGFGLEFGLLGQAMGWMPKEESAKISEPNSRSIHWICKGQNKHIFNLYIYIYIYSKANWILVVLIEVLMTKVLYILCQRKL